MTGKENGKKRITTPVCDFVRRYAASDTVRMHMPGHKGRGPLGCEALDITEITGADALYEASGVIRESEENAARLFGTKATFYGTEGSSQMIRAMLYLAGQWARERTAKSTEKYAVAGKEQRITILAARNVHKSFVQACALLDYDAEWLYGEEESYLSCTIMPETLENALKKAHKLPAACFITSPDYLGKTADIRALAEVCHRFGVPLLVDNAHGAYLRFLTPSRHPMDLGADLCCDSAHKTLPVLTGGAYLHVAGDDRPAVSAEAGVFGIAGLTAEADQAVAAPEAGSLRAEMTDFFAENAKSALALFGSTSPSYLILQSLDACNAYLAGESKSASEAGPNPAESFPEKLEKTVRMLDKMKQALREAGMPVMETEPLKLTLQVPGVELGEKLLDNGISYEFADPENLVLMPGPENTEEELQRCLEVLLGLADDFRRRDTGYTQNNPQNNPQNDIQKIPKILPENSLQHAVGNDQRLPLAERVLSIREAVFAPHETIPVSQSIGRIAASPTVSCPPAVPIVVSGERISAEAAAAFARYGIGTVEVVREAR